MLRYLLLLTCCALLADPTWGTIPLPGLFPPSETGLLGKLLSSRARARAQGKPLLPVMPLLQPVKLPKLAWVNPDDEEEDNQRRNSKNPQLDFSNVEPMDNGEPFRNNQVDENEDVLGNQRKTQPSANSGSRSENVDKKAPEVFTSSPEEQSKDVHRVLDSPLPNPGEGPTYTVFVRANDPNVGPTVHIVKHSVQTIMPVDAKNGASEILGMNMWRVPETLRNTEVSGRRMVQPGEDPEEVLGAARRDLIFRSGGLYGIPTRGGYGHGGYGLGGYGSELGYGGLGHGGLGHGGLGHGGLGHGGLGYGGLGHGGVGSGGYGGLGHSGLGYGGLGHGGLGHGGLVHVGIGTGGYGHGGFGHGGYAHGGYEEDAFGHGAHALDSFGHSSVGHTSYSESTHGESVQGENAYGAGAHGHHNFGAFGHGGYGVGHGDFGEYGLRSAESAQKEDKEEPVLGTGLSPPMFLPYMGLLDMTGERKYNHAGSSATASESAQYTKKHCFPPYCPIPQAHKHYQAPQAQQSYQAPQAHQTYQAPLSNYQSQQSQQNYQSSQAYQTYPQAQQTYQTPQAQQTYQVPQAPPSYKAPQAQQGYDAIQTHYVSQIPQIPQVVQVQY